MAGRGLGLDTLHLHAILIVVGDLIVLACPSAELRRRCGDNA